MRLLKKWFGYLFRRNPFVDQKEETIYVRKILDLCKGQIYENWLLKVVPKYNCIYVEMKSRGCGYIFGR